MDLMPAIPKPNQLVLRAYQVGFGDCLLLTFRYPSRGGNAAFDRHVLIDCGSSEAPRTFGKDLLRRVAEDIRQECGGKLHMVVATHRHSDHINGFATRKDGKGPGDIIRSCRPDYVLQPWTEDPKAATKATKPTRTLPASKSYLQSLAAMQRFSAAVLADVQKAVGAGKRLREQLAFLGETNLKNATAVKNLMTMVPPAGRFYLYFGCAPDLEAILPGVKVHVLGPPTVEQSDAILKQRSKDQSEFWHLAALQGARSAAGSKALFPRAFRQAGVPPHARWIVPRLQASRAEQVLELVRMLDEEMNNTSLILLFQVGRQKLLFPGDAQIENWSFALGQAAKRAKLKTLLEDVSVYKVGHHGSLNATPKSLWNMFRRRGAPGPQRLRTVLSTMANKHGSEERGTEVPRKKLVAELKARSDLFSTQELKKRADLKKVFTISL
jgi:hypothetical protein